MPANYVLLEKITVGANNATSVTFSSIPQTGYTDLVFKASARTTASGFDKRFNLYFNNNTSSYSQRAVFGTGSNAYSYSATVPGYIASIMGSSATANTFGNAEVYIPNYTGSTNKSYSVDNVNETNDTTNNRLDLLAGLWSNTAAITSIVVTTEDGTALAAGSTFYLYGVAKLGTTPAIVPYATGGDTIMTDGTYWYHTFTSSGTFTPQKSLSADYLVVAGGGGGASRFGGGGGAGGFRTGTALSTTTTAYTITVGAGGAGTANSDPYPHAARGSNSVFSSITSTGGGGGNGANGTASTTGTGGSGGGGCQITTGNAGNTPSTSPSQGNNGGNSMDGPQYGGGGGGGAGSVGGNAGGNNAGNGGNGTSSSYSGSAVTYAGGGGGGVFYNTDTPGTGGTGGGGAGGTGNGTNGTANRGGGGGGGGGVSACTGGNGGSGIVIIRYAV